MFPAQIGPQKEAHVDLTASVLLLAQAAPTPTPGGAQELTGGDKALTLWIIVGFILLAGIVVALGRRALEGAPAWRRRRRDGGDARATEPPPGASDDRERAGSREDRTMIRSWIAISLVGGLLIFTAVSFWISDTTLRSTLVGGLVANAGAAVAFYFASKSADQARSDILAASLPSTVTPNLLGDKPAAVNAKLASTSLRVLATPPNPDPDSQAIDQSPKPNQTTGTGSSITVTFAGPVPDLEGTPSATRRDLRAVGLELDPEPSDAGDDKSVVAGSQARSRRGCAIKRKGKGAVRVTLSGSARRPGLHTAALPAARAEWPVIVNLDVAGLAGVSRAATDELALHHHAGADPVGHPGREWGQCLIGARTRRSTAPALRSREDSALPRLPTVSSPGARPSGRTRERSCRNAGGETMPSDGTPGCWKHRPMEFGGRI
jgi:hypothetical protein